MTNKYVKSLSRIFLLAEVDSKQPLRTNKYCMWIDSDNLLTGIFIRSFIILAFEKKEKKTELKNIYRESETTQCLEIITVDGSVTPRCWCQ